MADFICKKCGSTEYEIKDKPNGTGIAHGLYCAKCGFWHKWLGKKELKQYDATKESKDEIIAKLQSKNAELKSRLDKAVELPSRDRVWFITEDEEGKESYIISKPTDRLTVDELYEIGKKYFTTREVAESRVAEE